MLGFDLRSPHRRATSSGSVNLNSPFVPSHVIAADVYKRTQTNTKKNRKNEKNMKNDENFVLFCAK